MRAEALGGCLCGAVRYELRGDFEHFLLCHCARCRKGTGSAHAANLFSKTAELRWLSGEAQVRVYAHPGTRHVKSFCSQCGSAVPSLQMGGSLLVVPAGSLDTEAPIRPQAHIFGQSRAGWDDCLEALPTFPSYPG